MLKLTKNSEHGLVDAAKAASFALAELAARRAVRQRLRPAKSAEATATGHEKSDSVPKAYKTPNTAPSFPQNLFSRVQLSGALDVDGPGSLRPGRVLHIERDWHCFY